MLIDSKLSRSAVEVSGRRMLLQKSSSHSRYSCVKGWVETTSAVSLFLERSCQHPKDSTIVVALLDMHAPMAASLTRY